MLEVLILSVVVEVVIETRVIDSVYVDVAMGVEEGFSEERVVPLGVGGVGGVQVLRLVTGLWDGQGLFDPIYGGVHSTEPGES